MTSVKYRELVSRACHMDTIVRRATSVTGLLLNAILRGQPRVFVREYMRVWLSVFS